MFEDVYIESDIKRYQNAFSKYGQNTRHLMLFGMCLRCEIDVEEDEFGLQGCFCSWLSSHEICDFC